MEIRVPGRIATVLVLLGSTLAVPKGRTQESPQSVDVPAVVKSIATALEEGYVDEAKGVELASKLRETLEAGEYDPADSASSFAARLTQELRTLSGDRHLAVFPPRQAQSSERPTRERRHPRSVNYGVREVEFLDGGVGYLKLTMFVPHPDARARLDSAMKLLANCDAFILDLRDNRGGDQMMMRYIASYFLPAAATLLTTFQRGEGRPVDVRTTEDHPDSLFRELPLYLLTSKRTFSAGEAFSFAMKINGRGTLVGEVTGGGGHFGGRTSVAGGFSLWLPVGRAYDKRTGLGWEGVGVEPHVGTSATKALKKAYSLAKADALARSKVRHAAELEAEAVLQEAIESLREGALSPEKGLAVLRPALDRCVEVGSLACSEINQLGYRSLSAQEPSLALGYFRYNTERYPEVPNTWDSLAEAYRSVGDLHRSIASYRKVLDLDPDNDHAATRLAEVQAELERSTVASPSSRSLRNLDLDPPTPAAGAVAQGFVALVNAVTDKEVVASRFYSDHCSASLRERFSLAMLRQAVSRVRELSGGLTIHEYRCSKRDAEPVEMTVVSRGRESREWLGLRMRIVDGGLDFIDVGPASPPANSEVSILSDQEVITQVDRYITALTNKEIFSGALLLAKEDEVHLLRAEGLAHRGFGVANTIETRFGLASLGKMMTAVAIAQLVEGGRLSYTDSVETHLTDYPNLAVRDRVRIEHLLSHSSGLGSHFTEEFQRSSRHDFRELRDFLPLFVDEPLAFPPGTGTRYSNAGFILLGLILEKVAGVSYSEYIREHISDPVGMGNTGFFERDIPVSQVAVGYTRRPRSKAANAEEPIWKREAGGWRSNTHLLAMKGTSAGGGYSTVEDLFRLAQALRRETLLSKESFETLITVREDLGASEYGFGLIVEEGPAGPIVGHNGGFPGVSTGLAMYLESGWTVVVLCNVDRGAAMVLNFVRRVIEQGR